MTGDGSRQLLARAVIGMVLVGALGVAPIAATPQAALAVADDQGVVRAGTPFAEDDAAETGVATSVQVSVPVAADRTIYLLGASAPVAASVRAVPAEGESARALSGLVEFFDGEVSLGETELVAEGDRGIAELETDLWPAAGAREVTAVFTPEADSGYAASTSAPRTYRVVDTTRMVPDVELQGGAEAEADHASLQWTIGNIWFNNFKVGFERQAIEGDVTLPEMPAPGPGASDEELKEYYFRPFTFSHGSGARDAEGNRVISFDGTARLTSGSANQWNFADPEVRIGANGDGYITAEFSGFYAVGNARQDYGPVRVTIATFSGAELEADDSGRVDASIPLNWTGQARNAGTWFYDYEDSFPNEFVALLNPLVAPFFARSAVATDASKAPHPVVLSFDEKLVEQPEEPAVALEIVRGPESLSVVEGDDARFSVEAEGEALEYRWQRAAPTRDAAADFVDISDAGDESSLEVAATLDDDGAQYRVIVSNAAGEITTEPATLTVEPATGGRGDGPEAGGRDGVDHVDGVDDRGGSSTVSDESATQELANTGWEGSWLLGAIAGIAAASVLAGGTLLARRRRH
ncbi:LPXTG cell wall anchor domain-containing protein [Microbacterium sp.]|uniref:LPXTG cell wall anchor domain-containing protein n=1 Tax=Microbacterium sp. TaxID=51671 RepID=UPI003F9CFDB6